MDTHNTTSDKVLERIKAEQIAPRSRNYFRFKNIGFWLLAALAVLVGAAAVSSVLFRIVNIPRVLPPGIHPPAFDMIYLMPVLWIVLFGVFSYLAYREIRSTNNGYKYELSTLLLSLLLVSLVLGTALYSVGTGLLLDRLAGHHLPFARDLEGLQRDRWLNPEHGFLVGIIRASTPEGLVLVDPGQKEWQVTFAPSVPMDAKNALSAGERVGLRGVILTATPQTFLACDIRSLEFSGRPQGQGPHTIPAMQGSLSRMIASSTNAGETCETQAPTTTPTL